MAVPREALVTPREDLSLLGFLCRLWTLDGGPFPGPCCVTMPACCCGWVHGQEM